MRPHLIRSKMVGYPVPIWLGGENYVQSHGYHGPHRRISPRIKESRGGSTRPSGGILARPHWQHAPASACTRRPRIPERRVLGQARMVQPRRPPTAPPRPPPHPPPPGLTPPQHTLPHHPP